MSYNAAYRIVPKVLVLLQHKGYNPQISAVYESKLRAGSMDAITELVHRPGNTFTNVSTALANSLDLNISAGRVIPIINGWSESRFSFILVVECYSGETLVSEEIYQGYTDHSETAGGNLANGGVVTLDPNMMMYINRVIEIRYLHNGRGEMKPQFHKAVSILADHTNSQNNHHLSIIRPCDLVLDYYTDALSTGLNNDGIIYTDANAYSKIGKMSSSDNEIGGRVLAKLLHSADANKNAGGYTYNGPTNSTTINKYEDIISGLAERGTNDYKMMHSLGLFLGVNGPTRFTLDSLSKFLPSLVPDVFTVDSYNDAITRDSNSMFHFNGDSDSGDSVLVDNQLTRFQKRIVTYLFDTMMSYGYVSFCGRMTNMTVNGEIHIEHGDGLLKNISPTVNANVGIRTELMKLLYGKLQDAETRELLHGGVGNAVEIVFDLTLYTSTVLLTINGRQTKIKVPSMADSAFSSTVVDKHSASTVAGELKGIVDHIGGIDDYGSKSSNQTVQYSEWI